MDDIFIKILFIIFILVVCYVIFNVLNNQYSLTHEKCDLENFDIDDLVVIKRTPEYSNLIDKIIGEKSFIFSDEQIKVLKNPQQIFKVTNNNNDIKNISDIIYTNCKGHLDNQVNNDYNNDPIDMSDNEYDRIKKMLKDDIGSDIPNPNQNPNIKDNFSIGPNCTNTGVLKSDMPFTKNYLKNYYKDLYGNRVEANLADYFTAYYTLINSDENVGLPVNTQIGHSNFIIPEQYNYDSHFTNAYNIDWDRIVNPIGYSM